MNIEPNNNSLSLFTQTGNEFNDSLPLLTNIKIESSDPISLPTESYVGLPPWCINIKVEPVDNPQLSPTEVNAKWDTFSQTPLARMKVEPDDNPLPFPDVNVKPYINPLLLINGKRKSHDYPLAPSMEMTNYAEAASILNEPDQTHFPNVSVSSGPKPTKVKRKPGRPPKRKQPKRLGISKPVLFYNQQNEALHQAQISDELNLITLCEESIELKKNAELKVQIKQLRELIKNLKSRLTKSMIRKEVQELMKKNTDLKARIERINGFITRFRIVLRKRTLNRINH